MVLAPELTLVGLQDKAVTSMGAIKVKLAVCEELFRVAVMMALWVAVTLPAVALKVAEL